MLLEPNAVFAALAHDTRLRCMLLLLRYPELCVCELTHAIGSSQPHLSRHLAHLREVGLVSDRRQGLWIHYRLDASLPEWVSDVLCGVARGVAAQPRYLTDAARLESMPNRPGAARCA